MSPDPTLDPAAEIQARQQRLAEFTRPLREAEKLLKDLGSLQDLGKVKSALTRLRAFRMPEADLDLAGLAQVLEGYVREQERGRPMFFGRALREAAEAAGVGFAPLTAEPPEYRLEPFTLAPSFAKGTAELRYARLPVAEVELEPKAILEARRRMLEALAGRDFSGEAWFDVLLQAYRRVLGGKPMGERVALVDLLPEIAFLVQSERFRRDPSRDHYQPYGRVRLAFDLARLRKSGVLRRHGLRVSLGSATLGTTRKKDDVLYLEDEGGRGQYYLSLWFAPDATP